MFYASPLSIHASGSVCAAFVHNRAFVCFASDFDAAGLSSLGQRYRYRRVCGASLAWYFLQIEPKCLPSWFGHGEDQRIGYKSGNVQETENIESVDESFLL